MRLEKQVPGLDCPLDHEYSHEEWRAFVRCAREGMESGERLHKEFYDEVEVKHGLSPREVERAVRTAASLLLYEMEGTPRLGLWDPEKGFFVVGTLPDGFVLTAFQLVDERHRDVYINGFEGEKRWLKK
jgi:hypothetical protein